MKKTICAALTCLLCLAAPAAGAWEALPAGNEASLSRGAALPALGQSRIRAPREQSLYFSVDQSNEFVRETNAAETILLDGESTRFLLVYRRGLGNDLELRFELPTYVVGGGWMDGFIQDWHHAFGLPNGGRDTLPKDQRNYRYTRNGVTLLNESGGATRLGDIQLGLGWQSNDSLAIRGMVKLPSGSESHLTGGTLGAAVWADWSLPFGPQSAWDGFLSGGLSAARHTGPLSSLQKTHVVFGGAGISYNITENWQALTQISAHSSLYENSNLDALRQPGLQLTVGGRYRLTPSLTLDAYFQEDPIVASSPDFSIHIGLTVR